jgi:hypothetical protein
MSRFFATLMAASDESHANQRRFNLSATITVVPEPTKKSATISCWSDEEAMILSSRASGFEILFLGVTTILTGVD